MDVTEYLWRDVERAQPSPMLIQALNTPAVRDALLRHAALHNAWDPLRIASQNAAAAAESAGWSRSGPDTVAGICHWITADRLLREVPAHDRAARLAGAVLSAWSDPQQVAEAVAASAALDPAAAAAFTHAVTEDARPGKAGEVMDEVEAALGDDPDVVAFACNTPAIRDAILRSTARSGAWADLANAADDAADAANAAGTVDAGPRTVAAIARWMLGNPAAADELTALRDADPLVGGVLDNGIDPLTAADRWAHSPGLTESAAHEFDAALNPPPDLGAVSDDPLSGVTDTGLGAEPGWSVDRT